MNVVSRWLRNARSVSLAQSVLPAVLAVVLALGSPGFNILYSLLAVFGVIINIAMIVQSLSSGIGQAIQPIVSVNYGAGESARVRKFFARGLAAVAAMTALVVLACMLLPRQLILLFMTDPGDALSFGPAYMRTYFMAFVFMVFNIFATYYLQAVMRPWLSVFVSLMRSLVLSGGLIMLLCFLIEGGISQNALLFPFATLYALPGVALSGVLLYWINRKLTEYEMEGQQSPWLRR